MSFLSRRSLAAVAAVGVGIAAITGLGAAPANASAPATHVISDDYVAPLQFAVSGRSIFVADSAMSALFTVGRAAPVATGPKPGPDPEHSGDLAGVAVNGAAIAYTTTSADHQDTRLTILSHGRTTVASLSAFERRYDPDKRNYYGLENVQRVDPRCKTELKAGGVPLAYRGGYDSHPYAVAALRDGSWAVADAGANDILRVDRWGRVSLIAVLPAQPVHMTRAMATASGAPHCAGVTYRFEPVPTDVEVGPRGALFATTLPGGPGSSAIGPRGSVYAVGRHWTHRIATGFAEATNLAIDSCGRIYVAELGSGVATIRSGRPQHLLSLAGVAGLEWANGHLYASTAPLVIGGKGPGTIVKLG